MNINQSWTSLLIFQSIRPIPLKLSSVIWLRHSTISAVKWFSQSPTSVFLWSWPDSQTQTLTEYSSSQFGSPPRRKGGQWILSVSSHGRWCPSSCLHARRIALYEAISSLLSNTLRRDPRWVHKGRLPPANSSKASSRERCDNSLSLRLHPKC